MQEDKRAGNSATLFNNESKGNTYITKLAITGDRSSTLKMPYTTKSTAYFGANGKINYVSPDGAVMKYSIYTKNGTLVAENREYDSTKGISLAALSAFDALLCNQFKVDIWAEKGNEKSQVNSKVYTFKGDIIAAFEYEDNNGTAVSAQNTVSSTEGNAELRMFPNGTDAADISYKSGSNALRAAASPENAWNFDTKRNQPDTDGYWLITASTKGYKDIKFSADQRSTEKGPRDYAISVSTDGENYTPLANSSVHVTDKLDSTYSNISLPAELNDKETVYIKIKIDGGETLSGAELESSTDDPTTDVDENVYGKGNTEINNSELCGTRIGNGLGIDGNPQTIEKGKTYMINFASAVNNPALILAGYNSNREMVIYNLHAGKFTIPSYSDVTDIKIMLWESLANITPIVPALTKTVE